MPASPERLVLAPGGAAAGIAEPLQFDVIRPDPVGTIRSLAALGYTPEAAVADIIDNSLAHGASCVDVEARWDGAEDSWLAVLDDGYGMDEATLVRGLTLGGGGADERNDRDLGRFGMGLKTASFSQARQLVVASRRDAGRWHVRTWDIDYVLSAGDWQLIRGYPPEARDRLAGLQARLTGPGTIVLWRRLTRLVGAGARPGDTEARREFHTAVERTEAHLGMVFSRFLTARTGRVAISLNGRAIAAWDPVLPGYPHVEPLPAETPLPGVRVQGFVLPHRSRLSHDQYEAAGGPRGWLDQQGFYIYRRDRLIVAGDWLKLGGFRKDEKHVLARVVVELPADQDFEWALDVKKSSATPPPSLAGHLRRVGKATRERAGAVISHRGRVVRDTQSAAEDFTWRLVSRFGEQNFTINRDHALVRDLFDRHPEAREEVRAVLSMIEKTLPVGAIRSTPGATATPRSGFDEDAPDDVVALAGRVLESLLAQRVPPRDAVRRVARMPPFSDYPTIAERLLPKGE